MLVVNAIVNRLLSLKALLGLAVLVASSAGVGDPDCATVGANDCAVD